MPRLRRFWADGAYRGRLVRWVRRTRRWVLQIISRSARICNLRATGHVCQNG